MVTIATKARLGAVATVLLLPWMGGCGDDGGGGGGGGADARPRVDAPGGEPGIVGLLVDPAGDPMPEVEVLACQATTCDYGASDTVGRFAFTLDPGVEVALKTHADLAQVPRLAAALEPVVIGATRMDVGTLYTPDLPDGAVLEPETSDPQTLAVGDGLEITLNRADLTPPIGDFLFDVAARMLPEEHIPPYPELDDATVVAVFAMHPFGTRSASAMGVRVPLDLPDDTTVQFRTISELDGRFSAPAPGTVSGGYATTDAGAGIERITYLVITR